MAAEPGFDVALESFTLSSLVSRLFRLSQTHCTWAWVRAVRAVVVASTRLRMEQIIGTWLEMRCRCLPCQSLSIRWTIRQSMLQTQNPRAHFTKARTPALHLTSLLSRRIHPCAGLLSVRTRRDWCMPLLNRDYFEVLMAGPTGLSYHPDSAKSISIP